MPAQRNPIKIQNQIQHLVDYIETHLDEVLSLEMLANEIGYSPFHLHHIFRAYTNETLGGYIRRRRLANALHWLTHSDRRIIEIALICGYQSSASFSKGFRQIYGITPSEVRKSFRIPVSISTIQIRPNRQRSYPMENEIREIPDQLVLAMERKGLTQKNFNKAADEAFLILTRFIRLNGYGSHVGACLGITPDENVDTPSQNARYIAGYFLKGDPKIELRGEVNKLTLPGGRYAVFVHKGPYEVLWKTWDQIYHDWFPESGFTLRDAMPYEVYVRNKQEFPPQELITEIYIPIQ